MDATVAVKPTAAVATPLVANSTSSSTHSSNSSSSNSSGYGSATTTPTNPASVGSNSSSSHSHYDSHSTTPVGTVEPMPVATVAAVTPYYSETYVDSHQRSSYYQSHSYPMATQAQVMPQFNSYDSYLSAGSYQHMSSVERNGSSARHASSSAYALNEKLAAVNSKLPASPSQQRFNHHTSNIGGDSSGAYGKLAAHTSESNSASTKPQAAATPFYAQPLHATNQPPVGYFDPYKYNVPAKVSGHGPTTDYVNYGGHLSNAVSATYQHQSYYAAGKTLQDATYTAAVKPLPAPSSSSRQHVSSPYAAGGGGAANNNTYYDKYMYTPTATPAAPTLSAGPMNPVTYPPHVPPPPPPSSANHLPQYPPEMSGDSYRKTPSWHWSMDYAAGNCRSLPPPPPSNNIPTAAVPPTNAAYLQQASSARDMYYPHDKYAGKYDKYNSYYHHQQYMSAARNVWSAAPHSHLGPPITERLPHLPPGATVAATHPSLPHHYASATAASGAARQSCCTQPFQQQNCYYPRPPHLIAANSYPPHAQQTHYAPTGGSNAGTNNGSSKYGVLDYAPHPNKTKSPNDLYAAASPYEAATAHLNYNYPSAATENQHYVGNAPASTAHQSLNPAIAPTQMHGDLSTAFYNDLNVQATYENYASAAMQPTQHQQYQQHQLQQHHAAGTRTPQHPPPSYAANSAKASLLDYRKSAAGTTRQAVDCYMTQSTQLTNLDEHAASINSYAPYELSGVSSALYASRAEVESADKTGANAKNLSLRDFLSTWNEDEEEYAANVSGGGTATEELNFIEPESQAAESAVTLQAANVAHMESGKPAAYVHDNVTGVPQSYKSTTASLPQPGTQQPQQQQQQQQIMENHLQFKGSFNTRPKIHVGITVDSTVDVETNQYINLPDIIIDIEKSNNVAPTLTPVKEETTMELKDISFGGFDVEKELDELQSKKVKVPVVEVVKPIRTDSVITQKVEALKPAKAPYECNVSSTEMGQNADTPSFKGLLLHAANDEIVHTGKQVNDAPCSPKPIIGCTPPKIASDEDMVGDGVAFALSTVHANPEPGSAVLALDNPTEQLIKDIDCDNNSHSNESTFEKEYETFINKIGSDTDVKQMLKDSSKVNNTTSDTVNADSKPRMDICKLKSDEVILCAETNEDIKRNSETEREFAQNIKAFSKFYKRKRKFSENRKDENCKKPALEENTLIANDNTNINQNFPKAYTKKCRKRKGNKRRTPQLNGGSALSADKRRMYAAYARNRKALAFYYRLLRTLRRFRFVRTRLDTSALVQQHIVTLKERRLPLIKRQSAKKYSTRCSKNCYNPKTLKCLSVGIVNTDAFRDGLLEHIECQATNAIAIDKKELFENISKPGSVNSADVATPADKSDVEHIQKCANNTERPYFDDIADEILPKNAAQMESNVIAQGHVADNSYTEELNPIDRHIESGLKCTPDAMDVESGPMESNNADIGLHSTIKNTNAIDMPKKSNTMEAEERVEKAETDTPVCKDNKPQQLVEMLLNADADKNMDVFDTASQPMEPEPEPALRSLTNSLCFQERVTSNDNDNSLSESKKYVGVIEVDENSNASSTDSSSVSSDSSSSSSSSDNSTDSSSISSSSDDDTLSSASEKSDLNELDELEKELSQHRSVEDAVSHISEKIDDNTSNYELEDMVREGSNAENANDIANLKKMLEDDSDEHDERQRNVVELVNKHSSTDGDEVTCGLQNSSKADKKQTAGNDCVSTEIDALGVHSAVEVAGKERFALEFHAEEVGHESSDEAPENSDTAQMKVNDVQAISNESRENSEGVLETADEVHEKTGEVHEKSGEVLEQSDEMLETSDEKLETSDEMLETSVEMLKTSVEVLETSDEMLETSVEVLEKSNEVHNKSDKVQMKDDEAPTKPIKVSAQFDEVLTKYNEVRAKSHEVLEDADEEKENQKAIPKAGDSSVVGSDTLVTSLKSLVTTCIDLNGLSSRMHNLNQDQIDQNTVDEFDQVEHKIPKLSDLCKIALSSSFETSAPTLISDTDAGADAQHKPLERELSVEEALAEMYRQAGVASDPEDYDMEDKETQDVLLINLEEILVSDSDLYVLQCDVNENVLSVVAHAGAVEAMSNATANAAANAERVNGLQLVEVLDDFQRNEDEELQMTATSENVLVQNESVAAAATTTTTTTTIMAPLSDKNSDKTTTTGTPAASSEAAENEENENSDNSLTSQFDLPTIHHEEIVPDNYKTFEMEKFIKYLHAKYVQKNISKFYHANRILKKYRRRFCKKVLE